jgi:hypothetical protein
VIQPTDLSDALSKAEVAGKINQMQKARPEMEQRMAASVLKDKTNIDAERAHELEKSDLVLINKDKENKEERHGKKKSRDSEEGSDTDKDESASPRTHLDLTA